jgi:hypothetical protein
MRVIALLKLLLLLPPPPPPHPVSPSALREGELAMDLIARLKTDPSFTLQLFTPKKKTNYGEKEKVPQRHNLTVVSQLPVARSGAVG